MESKLPEVKKKTGKRASRGGKSIRVETRIIQNSPGEHGETHGTTREGLTHAVVAFSASANSGDAFILQIIHSNKLSDNKVKNKVLKKSIFV